MESAEPESKHFASCMLPSKSDGKTTDSHRALVLQYQQNNEWCDVTLFGNGSTVGIIAHKMILGLASPYFRTVFKCKGFVESGSSEHRIEQIDHKTLQLIVDFIYTGTLPLADEAGPTLVDIMYAADDLLMSELVERGGDCAWSMFTALKDSEQFGANATVAMWLFCRKFGFKKREDEALHAMALHSDKIAVQSNFLDLNIGNVVLLIKSLVACTPPVNPDHICEAAIAWLEDNNTENVAYSDAVMRQVPLQAMSANALQRLGEKSFLSAQVMWAVNRALAMRKEIDNLKTDVDLRNEIIDGLNI